jgi:acyl-CoA reductase-like NAD-dependent aldehyde dehydrogenase
MWACPDRAIFAPSDYRTDLHRQMRERLEVGTAWVNQHRATSATVPFGGAKESGIGRQYSVLGLKENMEPQVIKRAQAADVSVGSAHPSSRTR